MKKARFTIGNKILGGFLIIIIIFSLYVVYSVIINNHNNKTILKSSEITDPSAKYLENFKQLVIRSQMYITNWVYLSKNNDDKQALKSIHNMEYSELKENLNELITYWDSQKEVDQMDSIFTQFEELLSVQKGEIMDQLKTFEDYEDPMIKFMAVEAIESQILPKSAVIIAQLQEIIDLKNKEAMEAKLEVIASSQQLKRNTIILGIVVAVIGIIVALIMSRSITKPINFLKEIIKKLGKGELPENENKKFGKDEIGEMGQAVDQLVNGLRSTSLFAENIGKGNYDSEFKPLSEHDVLGNALIEMRSNLKKVSEEDKRRNWATEGLAKFGEILRKNNDNIEKLSDQIISNLIKYLEANQGGLYIINEENEKYLSLAACYAWDKKKYLEQKIYEGEGLTGQAWIEKDTIYLTEVPDDYVSITSGLGEANPKSILIVPLKVNDEIFGVIEIASFNEYSEYEIEFVEKIAETIASTISSVKINQTTQKLLEESTELTEQMRAQEEEMRQNMEELQATQEEMQRANKEREAKERIVNSTNMMFELDTEFRVTNVNLKVKEILGYETEHLKAKPISSIMLDKESFELAKKAVNNDETWSGVIKLAHKNNQEVVAKVSVGKTMDAMHQSHKFLLFAIDIAQVTA
ncbi:MAG: GAF domain-containing protein [Candidatus Cyclobacteriaceae bacterium M3_2C_046]